MKKRDKKSSKRDQDEQNLLELVCISVLTGEAGIVPERLGEHFRRFGYRPGFLRDLADALETTIAKKDAINQLLELEPTLSAEQAAAQLSVDPAQVRRARKNLGLPPGRPGRPKGSGAKRKPDSK